MGRVISIVNQKGGVGKTTTAVNLSSGLALSRRKVLLIDIDPQGNATSGVGVEKNGLEASLYDVFNGVFSLSSVIIGTVQSSLWVAPANSDLLGIEIDLATKPAREQILKEHLKRLRKQFDYIIIDCPPSLGLLTVNAIVASDSLLVPLQCEYYALEGISSLIHSVGIVSEVLQPKLELEGIVLTMYDGRTNLCRQVEAEAREFFGDNLFKAVIPRNVRLSEASSYGQPVFLYDKDSLGARSYLALARELIEHGGKRAAGAPFGFGLVRDKLVYNS